jgi:hypothetical protein
MYSRKIMIHEDMGMQQTDSAMIHLFVFILGAMRAIATVP